MSENKVLKNGNISFADITDPTVGFELDDDENVVVIRNFNQSDTDKLIKSEGPDRRIGLWGHSYRVDLR